VHGVLPIPADAKGAAFRLAIRFADSSERLREDGRYAIRLGNEDIGFTAEGGWNILAENIAA
jgi:hypothetical protein